MNSLISKILHPLSVVPPKPALRRASGWKEMRRQFIAENGGKCAACGLKTNLEVHHIIPVRVDQSRELDRTNLIVLCENKSIYCHFVFGHLMSWYSHNPNVIGDANRLAEAIRQRPKA